ncbi:hypothetical protein C823_002041 [Eubacterium plexicaudatum ASF492]|uniref:Uncharacterized protein n=1 Tax=Eubacterium plexicaudatum ASF492 TaxID=1235802 RepID=N2BGH2_9FIRM|nr:hypothetical protein C823_002041 [Eubacterium plexicaudatum ASF492]
MSNETKECDRNSNRKLSGWKWCLSTVVISTVPFFVIYLFSSITNRRLLSLGDYTDDLVLIMASVAYGLFFFIVESLKKMKRKWNYFVLAVSWGIWVIALAFYFYNANAEEKINNNFFWLVFVLSLIFCIINGIIYGEKRDKQEENEMKERLKTCHNIFDQVISEDCKGAFAAITKDKCYCEVTDIDLFLLIDHEKEMAEKGKAKASQDQLVQNTYKKRNHFIMHVPKLAKFVKSKIKGVNDDSETEKRK